MLIFLSAYFSATETAFTSVNKIRIKNMANEGNKKAEKVLVLSDKYDITKHPNYRYTADADSKNAFDIEQFLSIRLKAKSNEVYDVYEVDTTADAS